MVDGKYNGRDNKINIKSGIWPETFSNKKMVELKKEAMK